MAGLKNVLVVEDDVMLRELYRNMLIDSKFNVETAGSADELFAKVAHFHPDCVLLDVMLPGISGLEILKALRTNPIYACQEAKIVLLTNLAQHNVTENAIKNGADGYIIKTDILPKDLPEIINSLAD